MNVDFVTFCCQKDIHRLYADDEVCRRVASHKHLFGNILVVEQRLADLLARPTIPQCVSRVYRSEDFPRILENHNIGESAKADDLTHGPSASHYWKWHVINHLIGLESSVADYIVFSDADCRISYSKDGVGSWVEFGIGLLEDHPEVLLVSPSDGGHVEERHLMQHDCRIRLTQNVSQQLFLCERERMLDVDFDVPWDWEHIAPGGPMQEYYYMLEGRMWRYMYHNNLWRAVLPDIWRYWHDQW